MTQFSKSTDEDFAPEKMVQSEAIQLSREGQERLAFLLLNPPPPTPALVRAFARHRAITGLSESTPPLKKPDR